MNTSSLVTFLLSLLNFSALGALFGIIYQSMLSAVSCIKAVFPTVIRCAREGRLISPRAILSPNLKKKGTAGRILSEVLNFILIIFFGVSFFGVWYILTDAVPRIIFPLCCIVFFFISGGLFGKVLRRLGAILAFIISLIPSVLALVLHKIVRKLLFKHKTAKNVI